MFSCATTHTFVLNYTLHIILCDIQNCIRAIDGTHVDARVPSSEKVAYIGRCGNPTQNIMAVCDFNMCFTFVMAGWKGSAHDSKIFNSVLRNHQHNFPMPPQGTSVNQV